MIEPLKFQEDSLAILNYKIEMLDHKMDSIILVNRDLMINKNYFSDIISTQMEWFAILFVLTFGILGLAYWIGIFKYFQNKFTELETNIKTTKNWLLSRIVQKDRDNQNKISSFNSVLENKINSIEKIQSELNNKKFELISEDISKLKNDSSDMISRTEKEIKEILDNQNKAYNEEKEGLLKELWDTNFNTQRSMFFSCYKDKNYTSALTWIIPMLEMIANDKVSYDINTFSDLAINCADNMAIDSTIKERFDVFNKTLQEIENNLEDDAKKESIKKLKIQLNKRYYTMISVVDTKK